MAYILYKDTFVANYFLQKVANDPGIASYNNVMVGGGNSISGNKNIIFGNNNAVSGTKNYIFSQNFNSSAVNPGSINNNLVLDDWVIQLLKMYMIPFGPSQAIDNWTYWALIFYYYCYRHSLSCIILNCHFLYVNIKVFH